MADEGGERVQLYVYDLSRGLARQLSPMLLGKQIEGIWHTAIVVGGTEYYFGFGINQALPGHSPFGQPLHVYDLGVTHIPEEVREEFLIELSTRYTPQSYSLLTNNCNTFSNELAELLVGRGIPAHITGLPAEVLSTPFGQMLQPMLQGLEAQLASVRQQPFTPHHAHPQQAQQPAPAAAQPPQASPGEPSGAPQAQAAPAGQGTGEPLAQQPAPAVEAAAENIAAATAQAAAAAAEEQEPLAQGPVAASGDGQRVPQRAVGAAPTPSRAPALRSAAGAAAAAAAELRALTASAAAGQSSVPTAQEQGSWSGGAPGEEGGASEEAVLREGLARLMSTGEVVTVVEATAAAEGIALCRGEGSGEVEVKAS